MCSQTNSNGFNIYGYLFKCITDLFITNTQAKTVVQSLYGKIITKWQLQTP